MQSKNEVAGVQHLLVLCDLLRACTFRVWTGLSHFCEAPVYLAAVTIADSAMQTIVGSVG